MTEIKTPRPLVAEAADAAHLRELLAVVLEALDIPYAATMGGEEVRSKLIADRSMMTVITLRAVVEGLPRYTTIAEQAAYLREHLGAHPVRGYVTWDTAVARREAGQDYMQSVKPQTPEEKGEAPLPDAKSEVQACGCGGEGCDTCSGTYVMTVPGQSVSEGPADEGQEQAEPGAGLQK
jgi:hypothetical protein